MLLEVQRSAWDVLIMLEFIFKEIKNSLMKLTRLLRKHLDYLLKIFIIYLKKSLILSWIAWSMSMKKIHQISLKDLILHGVKLRENCTTLIWDYTYLTQSIILFLSKDSSISLENSFKKMLQRWVSKHTLKLLHLILKICKWKHTPKISEISNLSWLRAWKI